LPLLVIRRVTEVAEPFQPATMSDGVTAPANVKVILSFFWALPVMPPPSVV